MTQLQEQATKVWQTITGAETIATYRQAIMVTWTIIRETAILLWLTLCLVLVVGDWFYTTAVTAGRKTRQWFSSVQQAESDQIASETGKALLTAGQNSVSSIVAQARTQLGLPEKPPVQVDIANAPASTSSTTPSTPTTVSTPASSASTSAPPKSSSDS